MRVHLCYAPEDHVFAQRLQKHLAALTGHNVVTTLAEQIAPGSELERARNEQVSLADCVILLLSADFINSVRCREEAELALGRQGEHRSVVVPVLCRPCLWREQPYGRLAPLPLDERPLSLCDDADAACFGVVDSLSPWLREFGTLRSIALDSTDNGPKSTPAGASDFAGCVVREPMAVLELCQKYRIYARPDLFGDNHRRLARALPLLVPAFYRQLIVTKIRQKKKRALVRITVLVGGVSAAFAIYSVQETLIVVAVTIGFTGCLFLLIKLLKLAMDRL